MRSSRVIPSVHCASSSALRVDGEKRPDLERRDDRRGRRGDTGGGGGRDRFLRRRSSRERPSAAGRRQARISRVHLRLADERNELDRQDLAGHRASVRRLLDPEKTLYLRLRSNGNHHDRAGSELLDEGRWNFGRRGGDQDGIERRFLLPAEVAVSRSDGHVLVAELVEPRLRLFRRDRKRSRWYRPRARARRGPRLDIPSPSRSREPRRRARARRAESSERRCTVERSSGRFRWEAGDRHRLEIGALRGRRDGAAPGPSRRGPAGRRCPAPGAVLRPSASVARHTLRQDSSNGTRRAATVAATVRRLIMEEGIV